SVLAYCQDYAYFQPFQRLYHRGGTVGPGSNPRGVLGVDFDSLAGKQTYHLQYCLTAAIISAVF
ncbi:MAG TPA: hypothetical protein ACQGQX_06275, partial [Xylella taiwanensis]